MTEYTYSVYETDQRMVATGMRLEDALILVKALMEEYYVDPMMSFTIVRDVPMEAHNG